MTDIDPARQYYYERETRRRAQRKAERQHWLRRVRRGILRLVVHYPGVRRVYVFGSLVQPGRFRAGSDLDIAVECDTLETESDFWRALERELERAVDRRPPAGPIAEIAAESGEQVYERQDTRSEK